MKKGSAEKWFYIAQQLRREFDESYARFMEHLIVGEQDFESIWHAHGSFDKFLSNTGLCDPAVYRKFLASRDQLGADVCRQIGTFGSMEAVRASEQTRPMVIRALAAWIAEKGVPPSQRTAHEIVGKLDPKVCMPRVLRASLEVERLRAEAVALRAEIRALKSRVAELEKKVANASVAKKSRQALAAQSS